MNITSSCNPRISSWYFDIIFIIIIIIIIIIIMVKLMIIIIIIFTIQDYLQNTVDKIDTRNFIKTQNTNNTKAFSLKIALKKTLDARSGEIYFAV